MATYPTQDVATQAELAAHEADVANPHSVTAAQTGAITSAPMKSPDFPVAASDVNRWRFSAPFTSAQVQSITVFAIGTAPTAGTVIFSKGIADGGNTLLSAASYSLSGLSDNAGSAMTLTGTAADLQGDKTNGFSMRVTNTDGAVYATVEWGPQ